MNMISNENLVIIQLNPTARFNYGAHAPTVLLTKRCYSTQKYIIT